MAPRRGRIVAVASTAGLKGYAYVSAYSAAKHAVIGLVRSLALETARSGITVNAICPGFVQGEWLEKGLGKEAYANLLAKTKAGAALNDAASPETVAQAVLGLVIGGDLTTGEAILVDGGSHLNASGVRR